MERVFIDAFEVWETDFRAHPEKYMTTADIAAMEVLPLSEQRAFCMVRLMNQQLSSGSAWNLTIGPAQDI